ncbi:MAG TPA: ATP-binding protein [Bryobacteraceae bacterium]|nr:ATP-binding protein [Bryobacteraceae bacterium]
MSLKARLRIAIVALVTLVVIAMSVLYLYDFTNLSFRSAFDRAGVVADEVNGNLIARLNVPAAVAEPPPSFDQLKDSWTRTIRTDPSISRMLLRMLTNENLVSSIRVTDDHGKVLAASDPALVGKTPRPARDFREIQRAYWFTNLWFLMTQSQDYSTTRMLGVNDHPLFNLLVVIKSDFVRRDVEPALKSLALAFAASLFIAIFLGSVLPNVLLDPLGRMSQSIDLILAGQFRSAAPEPQRETREFADVQSKLSVLGEQFRGAKQDALELRSNVEQLLQRLEGAVLLFDNTGRLRMAAEAAERLLGTPRIEMIGRRLEDLFPPSSALGNVIATAVQSRQSVQDQRVTLLRGDGASSKLLVSVNVLQKNPGQDDLGTLIAVRDAESRRQLERQLDLSSRLAALSRLTSGVAHEIKNPLNAMALQLEVLKGRLDGEQPEVDVIAGEIKRLDNVVKTFLNFNKPIEVQARPIDLSRLAEQVIALVSPEAQARQVDIQMSLEDGLVINGDADLLKQAILNVVNNGLEAMPEGGRLTVQTGWNGEDCQLTISDAGPGIAPEIRDRIFNLYFTTKKSGTGIGLATTFRVVQLHGGTIDFVSELGKGTTFRLRFPGMVDYRSEVYRSATGVS